MNLLEKSYLRMFSAALWYMITNFMSLGLQSRVSLLAKHHLGRQSLEFVFFSNVCSWLV